MGGRASLLDDRDSPALRRDLSVGTIALDDWFATQSRPPSFLKIDVEGSEMAVIQGMTRILRTSPPRAIVCEVSSGPSAGPDTVLDMLRGHGYTGWEITEVSANLLPLRQVQSEAGYVNALFVHHAGNIDVTKNGEIRVGPQVCR